MNTINAKTAEILGTITDEQWEAIFDIAKEKVNPKIRRKNLYSSVTQVMRDMGMPPHFKGYKYLREAVILTYGDESYIHNIVKRLFPDIARKFGTTAGNVERAIRYTIEVTCTEGNSEVIEKVFKGCYSTLKSKPENAKAIAAFVEYIKLHE